MSVEKIINEWKQQQYKPIYWFEGEEVYYIDELVNYAEKNILSDAEAAFNLSIFYGKDADWVKLINTCRMHPMVGAKQLVILKEAAQMKDLLKLEDYIKNPLPTTILIVAHKEKKIDGKTIVGKLIKKATGYLLFDKIKDYLLDDWAKKMIAEKGLQIEDKALTILVEHIGNDLSRMSNEVEKLRINLGSRKKITIDDIETYIGISKEYNPSELQSAIARRDIAKALQIVQYFKSNPKAGNIIFVLTSLYTTYAKLYRALQVNIRNYQEMSAIFFNKGLIEDSTLLLERCGRQGVEQSILLLHEYNLKGVGIANSTDNGELLKELVLKLLIVQKRRG